jgi:anti-anti-sigma factor
MSKPLFLSSNFFLGIPIDTNSSEELLKKIDEMSSGDKMSAVILTIPMLNSLFTWKVDKIVHPEVLQDIRKLDYVFLDQVDIGLLLKGWAKKEKNILIVGKNEGSLEHFREKWKNLIPDLKLEIYPIELSFEGKALEEVRHEDAIFFHDVMMKRPDILLVDGHKFDLPSIVERLSCKSEIPCILGFEMEPDPVKWTAWVKFNYLNATMEWKDYLESIQAFFSPKQIQKPQYLFFGQEQISFSVLKFPPYFFGESVKEFIKRHDFDVTYTIEVFDLSGLQFIDSNGLSLLMKLFKIRLKRRNHVFIMGITSVVKKAMKTYRIYDYFFPFIYTKREQLVKALEMLDTPFLWSFVYTNDQTTVYFFGQLDVRQDQTYAFENISAKLLGQKIIFNFEWCYYVDSSGLGFLLRLRKLISQLKKSLVICGLNEYIEQTLKLTKVDKLFHIEKGPPMDDVQ